MSAKRADALQPGDLIPLAPGKTAEVLNVEPIIVNGLDFVRTVLLIEDPTGSYLMPMAWRAHWPIHIPERNAA